MADVCWFTPAECLSVANLPGNFKFLFIIHESIIDIVHCHNYSYTSLIKELASQAQQARRSTSAAKTTLSFGVHLEGHLSSRVDSRLLVAALK